MAAPLPYYHFFAAVGPDNPADDAGAVHGLHYFIGTALSQITTIPTPILKTRNISSSLILPSFE
jgi:hypothetical protein